MSIELSRHVADSAERVFAVAADIERYPDFLTGWIFARIVASAGNTREVDQVLGLGPLHLRFRSRAVFDPPRAIVVTSAEAPFRRFCLTWRIVPEGHGCLVSISADVLMRSRLMQLAVDRMLRPAVEDIMEAFAARAAQRSGVANIAATNATPPTV